MDQMSGIDTTAYIRKKEKLTGKHIPVIGVTSLVGNSPDDVVCNHYSSLLDYPELDVQTHWR